MIEGKMIMEGREEPKDQVMKTEKETSKNPTPTDAEAYRSPVLDQKHESRSAGSLVKWR
jgi:hypothetical protein